MRLNQMRKLRRFGVLGTASLVGYGLNYYARKHVLRRRHLVRKIHDYKLLLDLRDPGLSRDVAVRGSREEQLKYIIDRTVGPGDVILDVGANIGYYAIMLAKRVGSSGKVYAMEPEPRNFDLLQRNIRLNGADQIVEAFHIGASNVSGVEKLNVSRFSNLHSFLSDGDDSANGSDPGELVEVPMTDLSSFIQGKRRVDMLRMDIEGYEVEVLTGLEEAIRDGSWTGNILFECHFPRYTQSHSMREPLKVLLDCGYHARYMSSTDESKPRIRTKGYQPTGIVRTSDTRYQGIYENIGDEDTLSLICDMGGVRDVLFERSDGR